MGRPRSREHLFGRGRREKFFACNTDTLTAITGVSYSPERAHLPPGPRNKLDLSEVIPGVRQSGIRRHSSTPAKTEECPRPRWERSNAPCAKRPRCWTSARRGSIQVLQEHWP